MNYRTTSRYLDTLLLQCVRFIRSVIDVALLQARELSGCRLPTANSPMPMRIRHDLAAIARRYRSTFHSPFKGTVELQRIQSKTCSCPSSAVKLKLRLKIKSCFTFTCRSAMTKVRATSDRRTTQKLYRMAPGQGRHSRGSPPCLIGPFCPLVLVTPYAVL